MPRIIATNKPRILLGLTATPERLDGKNILAYFDGRIASEMRLAEAKHGTLSFNA